MNIFNPINSHVCTGCGDVYKRQSKAFFGVILCTGGVFLIQIQVPVDATDSCITVIRSSSVSASMTLSVGVKFLPTKFATFVAKD